MTRIRFVKTGFLLTGFEMSGHADAGPEGADIVCAAVSSAAYLVANTLTDVMNLSCRVAVKDGGMSLAVSSGDAGKAQDLLNGLRMHLRQLQQQYPKNITVTNSEV